MQGEFVIVYPNSGSDAKPEAGVLAGSYLFIRRNDKVKVIHLGDLEKRQSKELGGVEPITFADEVPYNFMTVADKFLEAQEKLNSLATSELFTKAEAELKNATQTGKFKGAGGGAG